MCGCNSFKRVLIAEKWYDSAKEQLENQVSDFIREEWNPDLKFFVEYTGYDLEITVCDKELDYNRFEYFIINPLIKKYGCHINYREVVTNVEKKIHYVEWGLGLCLE